MRGALGDVARTVSLLVGDGCLIRVRGDDGALAAVAAHHRDPEAGARLSAAVAAAPPPESGGWLDQALERNCVLRLPEIEPLALREAAIPADLAVADVIVVPIAAAPVIIVGIRDGGQPAFSFADRLALERIAADLAHELDVAAADRDGAAVRALEPGADREAPSGLAGRLRLLDLTSAGLWLIDSRGVTAWVNEAASELVGIPADHLVGARVPEFIAGADGALGSDLHAEGRSDRKLTRPDGSRVWLATTSRPLFDDRGNPAGTLLTLCDIDERKRREVDLRMRLQAKEALVDLAESSLGAPGLGAILAESVQIIAEQLDAALTSICTIDPERREATVRAAAAQGDDCWPRQLLEQSPVPVTAGAPILVAAELGKTVVVDDFGGDDPTFPVLVAHGIRSGAFVPFGDRRSVLTVLSRHRAAIDAAALPLIESVARMITSYRSMIGEAQRRGCAQQEGEAAARTAPDSDCAHTARRARGRVRRRRGA